MNPQTGSDALTDALNTSFRVLRFVLVAVVIAYLFSGVFVVHQHEKAVVLLFGRLSGPPTETARGPGLHVTWPRPFAEIIRVPAERAQSLDIRAFWYHEPPGPLSQPEREPLPPTLKPLRDGYTLTGDANILHSVWRVSYLVSDPLAFLFSYAQPEAVISNELIHAVIAVSARYTVDQALRLEVEAFRSAVEQSLRDRIETLQPGVRIERVELPALAPPRQVDAAFSAVIAAEQERSARISGARAEATRLSNEAAGTAGRIRSEGAAQRLRTVTQTAADADYFKQVYEQYRKNPAVTQQTLWQDTVTRVLEAAEEKYVVQSGDTGRQELRLLLGPEKQKLPQAGAAR